MKENENVQENEIDQENSEAEKTQDKEQKKKKIKKKERWWVWPVKIFVIALILSFSFSFLSEFIFSKVGLIVSIVVAVVLLTIGIIFDMIGVAVTASSIGPFTSMMSRKVYGSDKAMKLIKNAEKVASICNDVVGDICGILTGAAGANIALRLLQESMGDIVKVVIISSVSAVIAGFTIFGKACLKKVAIKNSTNIVLKAGKVLKFLSFKGKKRAKKK